MLATHSNNGGESYKCVFVLYCVAPRLIGNGDHTDNFSIALDRNSEEVQKLYVTFGKTNSVRMDS